MHHPFVDGAARDAPASCENSDEPGDEAAVGLLAQLLAHVDNDRLLRQRAWRRAAPTTRQARVHFHLDLFEVFEAMRHRPMDLF